MVDHTPAPTPSRGVYGFALYLTCTCFFIFYIAWAIVPDWFLHAIQITYYPQKYWALALPVYVMVGLAMFAFFIYPGLNLLLTPSLNNMNTVTDSFALYRDIRVEECKVNESETVKQNNVHGIPPASDVHLSHVCRILYLDKRKKF